MFSLVRISSSPSRPGIGGMAGRVPVPMYIRRAVMWRSPTATVCGIHKFRRTLAQHQGDLLKHFRVLGVIDVPDVGGNALEIWRPISAP